jgi:hypothetical protein
VKTANEFFAALVTRLEACGVPYMLTGSVASSSYGEARSTNDFDIVIDPSREALEGFLASLPSDWYVSHHAAMEALRTRSMFNVIDPEAGWKSDLIVRGNRSFDIEEFNRRTQRVALGVNADVITPEDSILSKLDWSRESLSSRQFDDSVGVATANLATLDIDYLRKWALQLGVEGQLDKVLLKARSGNTP